MRARLINWRSSSIRPAICDETLHRWHPPPEESATLDVIPIRLRTDEEGCVYLLDDAHLLGNFQFTMPDGKQYGSVYLLDDFHEFTELGKCECKAIFFGAPYQTQRSDGDDFAPMNFTDIHLYDSAARKAGTVSVTLDIPS